MGSYADSNKAFMDCINGEIEFEELLTVLTPYFKRVATSCADPCEAFSEMSMSLYSLLDVYDATRGKPMGLIRMKSSCIVSNVNRKYKIGRIIIDEEQAISTMDCSVFDNSDETGTCISPYINEEFVSAIEDSNSITDFQKREFKEGRSFSVFSDKRRESFQAELLNKPHIEEWYNDNIKK